MGENSGGGRGADRQQEHQHRVASRGGGVCCYRPNMSLNEAMASSRLNTNTTTSTSTSISSIRSIRSDGGVSTSNTSCMPSSSSSWCVGMGVSIGAATAAAAAAAAFVYYKYYYKHNAKKSDRRSVVDSKRTETGGEITHDVKTENKENKDEKDNKAS